MVVSVSCYMLLFLSCEIVDAHIVVRLQGNGGRAKANAKARASDGTHAPCFFYDNHFVGAHPNKLLADG